ncbi:MAG TPA: response regulator [Blastocatellia bacterium]|nr:response regulator [Blastocatellia bacterium]
MSVRSKPLTTGEVARYCHVTVNGVKKWIAEGKLKAFQLPGGHYRVEKQDFREFLEQFNIPVEPEFFDEWKKKVLIVDDEENVVNFIRTALEQESRGFLIETAVNGYDALMKVGDFKPDLLILDIRMPMLDGYGVCKRLSENPQTSHIKTIIVTGEFGDETVERIEAAGVSAYMFKPLDLDQLKSHVYKVLGLARPRASVHSDFAAAD